MFTGIRKTARATRELRRGFHVDIYLNRETDEIFSVERYGDAIRAFADPHIIHVARATAPMTMAAIEDAARMALHVYEVNRTVAAM